MMKYLRAPFSRWVDGLAFAAILIGAAACLWIAWCEFPLYAWNDVRLAPAFALRDGINPYPLLGGGPLSTWIYGPVGIFINLPATIPGTLLGALRCASLINAFIVLGPLVAILFSSAELRACGRGAGAFACALAVLLVPKPNLILQVTDHTAIAFGILSLWLLAQRATPSPWHVAAAAALASLALWTKQIAVLLPLAHLAYLLWRRQRTAVRLYLAWSLVFSLSALVAFIIMFGFDNLWLNLVEIPARLGWAEIGKRIAMRKWALLGQVVLPPLGLLALWRTGRWPACDTVSGRFFILGALAFGVMLPIGLLAFFKIGGDTNLLHSWDYLMPAAVLAWLVRDTGATGRVGRRLLVAVAALSIHRTDLVSLPGHSYTQQLDTAAELAAQHPQAIWFPQNPLITYFAERKLWHSEDGVSTRFLAGYGLREADFRRYLPPRLEAIAYPSVNNFPFSLPLLPEFSEKHRVPYWVVYVRPSKDDAPTQGTPNPAVVSTTPVQP